jgi:CheY-like chemotaxis protein
MTDSKRPGFDFSEVELLASALHAQLLARRRATIEHDLKNVVHGLMSGTELLAKSLTATSARITPAECVSLLQQQLSRAQATLHRILDEVAPADQQVMDVDLGELVNECIHALRHQLQMLDVQTSIATGLTIRVARTRFKDALLCVLLDCVDRMPPRARITIDASGSGDQVTISMHHVQTTDAASPTLPTMAKVLEADGAQLTAAATGNERTLQVQLALMKQSRQAAGALELLIVDANRDAADSLAMLAQLDGFTTETAYDLNTAHDKIRVRSPQIVLIDLDGSVDSHSLVRTIRSAAGQQPRVVGLSHSHVEGVEGIDNHLRKPLDPTALRRLTL